MTKVVRDFCDYDGGDDLLYELCRPSYWIFVTIHTISNSNDYIKIVHHHLSRPFVRR